MNDQNWTSLEKEQILAHGLTIDKVNNQIKRFKKGFPSMKLHRAATPGDGILVPSDTEKEEFISFYKQRSGSTSILKFVPASGAASRMFKVLFAFMEQNLGSSEQEEALKSNEKIQKFFNNLELFAFKNDLEQAIEEKSETLGDLLSNKKYAEILEYLLTEKGLNYGNLPKGLLKFHDYGDQQRMPIEEHMIEGALYTKDSEGKVKLHFTVSPEHLPLFKKEVEANQSKYEEEYGVKYEINFSIQKNSTDTIAVNEGYEPFREEDNSLLFRPAGHGALIENLNDAQTDLAFIKNIDNVVTDEYKDSTVNSKSVLAGVLLSLKDQTKAIHDKFIQGEVGEEEIVEFLKNKLNTEFESSPDKELLVDKLKRPIRVCGMVINEGEPGGGPFWCYNSDGSISLQIVESSQIDMNNQEQKDILQNSTHFNPVDVVLSKTNLHGEPIDLLKHVDPETGFISDKSKSGKSLKAMELPGLWNGSMSDWSTVFVEVPADTFSPVKEVNDLLRDLHQ